MYAKITDRFKLVLSFCTNLYIDKLLALVLTGCRSERNRVNAVACRETRSSVLITIVADISPQPKLRGRNWLDGDISSHENYKFDSTRSPFAIYILI